MTAAPATVSESPAISGASPPPAGWEALHADPAIQFAPVAVPPVPPREPNGLLQALDRLFAWLGDLFAPLGQAFGEAWWWLQWVLLGIVVLLALVLLARLLATELVGRGQRAKSEGAQEEWRPDPAASLALLEDADRLAADGRYGEATHLLLQRSVGHIAAAQPDWTRPSSTARELAALPALPEAARAAFRVIAERVERSLFALRALDRADWEAARAAYAEFALARLDARGNAA
ncbi:MAG: hypothetical protein ACKO01_11420 [Erythrobacter sp.]